MIADDLDRTQEIATIATIVGTAEAGVVLTRGGDTLPLPGLPGDPLLAPDSRILAAVTQELSAGGTFAASCAPAAGPAGGRLVRISALQWAFPDLNHLWAVVRCVASGAGVTVHVTVIRQTPQFRGIRIQLASSRDWSTTRCGRGGGARAAVDRPGGKHAHGPGQ